VRNPLPLLLTLCSLALAPVCQADSVGDSVNDKQSRDLLDKALQDKNPETRRQGVIALSLIGDVAPYPSELSSMLADKDVEVRLAVVSSLSDLKSNRSTMALRRALDDGVPEVSFAAARALWALGDPTGKDALLSVLEGESKTASGFFAKQKRDTLRMMHMPKAMFLFAVKQGVGFAPVPGLGTGISSMQAILSDPGTSGRATAALLLGKETDKDTLDALLDALNDKEWGVRAAAVHSLVLRDDPAQQNAIARLLDDKSEPVRLRAAAGYLRLQSIKNRPPAKPALKRRPTKAPAKKT
jgi:HEAT repeat protein